MRQADVCSVAPPGWAQCHAKVVVDDQGTAAAAVEPHVISGYGPDVFHKAYALPKNATTWRTVAVVIAYDNPSILKDLNVYNAHWGLPAFKSCSATLGVKCLKKVNQNGNASPRPAVHDDWAVETALDVQTVHGICQNCKILVVEAWTPSFTDLAAAEQTAVKMGADVITHSWGADEFPGEQLYAPAFNHPFIPTTFSTGDKGYRVSFPASLNTVIAVGGTTLHVDSINNWTSETAWSGSGSGCSAYFPARTPQATPMIENWSATGCGTSRAVSDVSADADPHTGAAIYLSTGVNKGWHQYGGTSLAAPLVAGAYALAGKPAVAYPAARLYAQKAHLHDPFGGETDGCPDTDTVMCNGVVGYDGPTGIGSPNGLVPFKP